MGYAASDGGDFVHDYRSHLGFVSCTLLHILLHARAER